MYDDPWQRTEREGAVRNQRKNPYSKAHKLTRYAAKYAAKPS